MRKSGKYMKQRLNITCKVVEVPKFILEASENKTGKNFKDKQLALELVIGSLMNNREISYHLTTFIHKHQTPINSNSNIDQCTTSMYFFFFLLKFS
jgi:hypothetical protein